MSRVEHPPLCPQPTVLDSRAVIRMQRMPAKGRERQLVGTLTDLEALGGEEIMEIAEHLVVQIRAARGVVDGA